MAETAEQLRLRQQHNQFQRWAKEDPRENAERGQRGLFAKFVREAIEHEPGLTDAEYERRARCAYKAHMLRLALASSKARAARKAGNDNAA